jgi:hypothetical protein
LLHVRLEAEPERIGVGRDAQLDQAQRSLFFGLPDRHVIVRPKLAARHVNRSRMQAHELRVLIGDDLQDKAIEIRKERTVRGRAPVSRIAIEDDALAGLILAQYERPGSDDVGGRRLRIPHRRKRAGGERFLELVLRQDRQSIEEAHSGTRGSREREDHGARVGCRGADPLAAGDERAGEHAPRLRVVHRLQGEKHIGGRNGVPSDHVTPLRRCIVCVRPSSLDSHFSASDGSRANVALLMRTNRPWVRRLTSSDV